MQKEKRSPNNISKLVATTPIGLLQIIATDEAIIGVKPIDYVENIAANEAANTLVKKCKSELEEYFAGTRTSFDLPLKFEGTDFQKQVWQQLKRIPYGETKTYGKIAKSIDKPKAARAIGMANHNNPILIIVPCHRVIGADGSLTGYAAGIEAKKYLLEFEKKNK